MVELDWYTSPTLCALRRTGKHLSSPLLLSSVSVAGLTLVDLNEMKEGSNYKLGRPSDGKLYLL